MPAEEALSDSESWMNEFDFWYERGFRASIRFEDALGRGDTGAAEIAFKQFELYKRRFDAVPVPEEVHNRWKQEKEAERLAALNEQ